MRFGWNYEVGGAGNDTSGIASEQDGANPITLDLNGAVAIRAKAADQVHANELVLSRSQFTGKAVALCLPRQHLARALRLGLSQLHVHDVQTPMVWQDQRRKFIVMPLPKESIIPPSPQALRVQSSAEDTRTQTPIPERTKPTMARTQPQGAPSPSLADRVDTLPVNGADLTSSANGHSASRTTIQNLIDEAQAMRTLLRSAYDRAGRLITAIRQNDKRTKTFRTALASLRELQQVG